MTTINCRAKVDPSCYDGKPAMFQFGEDLPLSEDGTFDGASILCDPCYLKVMPYTDSGRGLNHELPAAIAFVRSEQKVTAAEEGATP